MKLETKLLLAYSSYVVVAAGIVFLAPWKYHSWAIGFIVLAEFGLWRLRKLI